MIARNIILFVLLIVLPYLWVDYHFLLKRKRQPAWRRLIWWCPCVAMLGYTVILAREHDFIPRSGFYLEGYLLLLGLFIIPVAVFALCSAVGYLCHRCRTRSRYADGTGVCLALLAAAAYFYGFTTGFNRVVVKHVELSFDDLPAAFDGCRIVHVSDLHVGTYRGWRRHVLSAVIDSINSQHADYIFFTGDLQNTRPEEVESVREELSKLRNVYSVLGNHDHGEYIRGTEEDKHAVEDKLQRVVKELGWTLLVNESTIVTRSAETAEASSSEGRSEGGILLIGTDNDGEPPFPALADYQRAYGGRQDTSRFCIMLQHDPSAWRRNILPKTTAQLTLSGHTHGGQIGVGSLRPTRIKYSEDSGLYQEGNRYLHVSNGAGALVPFRLGICNEITVITLMNCK
jgi:predicted MPP superfamily phosphohydrolase